MDAPFRRPVPVAAHTVRAGDPESVRRERQRRAYPFLVNLVWPIVRNWFFVSGPEPVMTLWLIEAH